MRWPALTTLYLYGILVVLFGVVVHAPISVYLGMQLPELAVGIKAWKEILMSVLGLAALALLTKRGLWRPLLREWLVRVALAYIVLHIILAVSMPDDLRSQVAGLMIDLRFVAFFLLAYVAVRLRPDGLAKMLKTVVAGALVVLGFGLLQITVLPDNVLAGLGYGPDTIRPYTTIDRNPDFVRINSTLRGPNPLGAMCLLYLSLALAYAMYGWRRLDPRRKVALLISMIIAVMVLFASYSRSAYVAAMAASTIVGLAGILRRPSKRLVVATISAALAGVAGLFLVQTTDWYSNVILHEDPESTVVSKSNQEHVNSLLDGTARVARQPLGAGVGSTGSASLYDADVTNDAIIENWYLFVAHESGWLGLTLFLAFNGLVLRGLWRLRKTWPALAMFAAGIGLALIGFLLPVWADETVALTWWGLAGGILGNGYATRTRQ